MEISLIEFSLLEFFQLEKKDVYFRLAQYVKATDNFRGKKLKDINTITFDEVGAFKKVLREFTPSNCSLFLELLGVDIRLEYVGFYEFYGVWKYAVELIEKIIKLEMGLKPYVSMRAVRAGIDRFNELGDYSIKHLLGREFGLPPQEVGKWGWIEVFKSRKFNAIESVFNNNLENQKV